MGVAYHSWHRAYIMLLPQIRRLWIPCRRGKRHPPDPETVCRTSCSFPWNLPYGSLAHTPGSTHQADPPTAFRSPGRLPHTSCTHCTDRMLRPLHCAGLLRGSRHMSQAPPQIRTGRRFHLSAWRPVDRTGCIYRRLWREGGTVHPSRR